VPDPAWADEAVRGALGLLAFLALFAAARFRFTAREGRRGPADIGLD
jgi:hypothetical protein